MDVICGVSNVKIIIKIKLFVKLWTISRFEFEFYEFIFVKKCLIMMYIVVWCKYNFEDLIFVILISSGGMIFLSKEDAANKPVSNTQKFLVRILYVYFLNFFHSKVWFLFFIFSRDFNRINVESNLSLEEKYWRTGKLSYFSTNHQE